MGTLIYSYYNNYLRDCIITSSASVGSIELVTSPSAFSSTLSVEAQISIARAEAEAASASENDVISGNHDDDDVDYDDNSEKF